MPTVPGAPPPAPTGRPRPAPSSCRNPPQFVPLSLRKLAGQRQDLPDSQDAAAASILNPRPSVFNPVHHVHPVQKFSARVFIHRPNRHPLVFPSFWPPSPCLRVSVSLWFMPQLTLSHPLPQRYKTGPGAHFTVSLKHWQISKRSNPIKPNQTKKNSAGTRRERDRIQGYSIPSRVRAEPGGWKS
jgi:hypothetical protein